MGHTLWPLVLTLSTYEAVSLLIFRYLAKEVLQNMFAVSLVLLLISISARFVSYLAEAAAGQLDAGVLLTLMAFRLPAYMELILPLGLFIGILLAYGRLYVDSEMVVLSACGMSERRLVLYTFICALFVAAIVAVFSLFLGPEGVRASETLLAEQRNRTDFETLKPARFHVLDGAQGISYAESISDDRTQLRHVFMAQLNAEGSSAVPHILVADSGATVIDKTFGKKYLKLSQGRRYIGQPGEADFEVVEFAHYSQLLPEADYNVVPKKATDGMTTLKLMEHDGAQVSAALQWRLSLPLLVIVVALLAVPLSRTQPRRGRYGKLLPAILIYIVYLVCVNAARGLVEEGKAPLPGLLWWVHGGFFLLAFILLVAGRGIEWLKKSHDKPHRVVA